MIISIMTMRQEHPEGAVDRALTVKLSGQGLTRSRTCFCQMFPLMQSVLCYVIQV